MDTLGTGTEDWRVVKKRMGWKRFGVRELRSLGLDLEMVNLIHGRTVVPAC